MSSCFQSAFDAKHKSIVDSFLPHFQVAFLGCNKSFKGFWLMIRIRSSAFGSREDMVSFQRGWWMFKSPSDRIPPFALLLALLRLFPYIGSRDWTVDVDDSCHLVHLW